MCDNKKLWSYSELRDFVILDNPHYADDILSNLDLIPFIEEAKNDDRCGFIYDNSGSGRAHLIIKSEPWNVTERGSCIGFLLDMYNTSKESIYVWNAYKGERNIRDGRSVGQFPTEVYKKLDDFIVAVEDKVDVCPVCHKRVGRENMQAFSFAGRCCEECLPEMKKKYEPKGWYN